MATGRNPREQQLIREGWTKQFLASGSRLREAAELYESMGWEVHLEPVRAEDLDCSECFQEPLGAFADCSVIYTRLREKKRSPHAHAQDEDLW